MDMISGPFYVKLRNELSKIYNKLGIYWEINTIFDEKESTIYQIEKREPLKVITHFDGISYQDIYSKWGDILAQLENNLHLKELALKYNIDGELKLIRDCLPNYIDYALYNDNIILLDDADFFIAVVKDGEWSSIPFDMYIDDKNILTDINFFSYSIDDILKKCNETIKKLWIFEKDVKTYINKDILQSKVDLEIGNTIKYIVHKPDRRISSYYIKNNDIISINLTHDIKKQLFLYKTKIIDNETKTSYIDYIIQNNICKEDLNYILNFSKENNLKQMFSFVLNKNILYMLCENDDSIIYNCYINTDLIDYDLAKNILKEFHFKYPLLEIYVTIVMSDNIIKKFDINDFLFTKIKICSGCKSNNIEKPINYELIKVNSLIKRSDFFNFIKSQNNDFIKRLDINDFNYINYYDFLSRITNNDNYYCDSNENMINDLYKLYEYINVFDCSI